VGAIMIDIKDLVRRVLLKWRIILIFMLFGAVLITVLGGYRSYSTASTLQKAFDIQQAAGGPVEGETLIVVPPVVWIAPSNIFLGLLLGAIGAITFFFVIYVFSPKLRSVADVTNVYGIPVLGVVSKKTSKSHKIDLLIADLFSSDPAWFTEKMRISMMCTEIMLAAKKESATKLFLSTTHQDEDIYKAMSVVYNNFQESNLSVSCGKSVVYYSQSLKKMAESDGVILFEKIDASTYEDIRKEISFCDRYQIPVLGCIVVK